MQVRTRKIMNSTPKRYLQSSSRRHRKYRVLINFQVSGSIKIKHVPAVIETKNAKKKEFSGNANAKYKQFGLPIVVPPLSVGSAIKLQITAVFLDISFHYKSIY